MLKKLFITSLSTLLAFCLPITAQSDEDGMGQTIQIYTHFHSIIGKPQWLLIIRDLDHGQELPYIYDIKQGDNFWLALTYSRNYIITVSTMRFNPRPIRIQNFCHMQSGVIRGQSLYVTIDGDLRPDTSRFSCHISRYADSNFSIAPSSQDN